MPSPSQRNAARGLLTRCCLPWLACLAWTAGMAGAARAGEQDQIATDRPDFVDSSTVVGAGRFQVETSIDIERDRNGAGRERTSSTPTLLRYGIGDTLELRFETDGRMRSVTTPANGARGVQSGYGDSALGLKWHLADGGGARPALGVVGSVEFDSGSAPFRAPGMGGTLRLAAEWELPDDYSLGVMPGLSTQRDDQGRRYTGGIFGVVLGKDWGERLHTFIELAAPHIAPSRRGGSQLTADIGAAWLLTHSVQIDTALSRGLNRTTPDYSWTAGLSVKF